MQKLHRNVVLVDKCVYIYLESLGELENAVETLAWGSCSHNISGSPKLPLVFL